VDWREHRRQPLRSPYQPVRASRFRSVKLTAIARTVDGRYAAGGEPVRPGEEPDGATIRGRPVPVGRMPGVSVQLPGDC
jgi:hypothetical protein